MRYIVERNSVHTPVYDPPCWAWIVKCCEVDFAPEMGAGRPVHQIVEFATGSG